MASPANIMSALVSKFNTTFPAMTLRYGRRQETDARPYAVYTLLDDSLERAFRTKVIDSWYFQFSIFDIDGANVAALLNTLNTAFDRTTVSLATGTNISILRQKMGYAIMPKEDANSSDVYQGWVIYKFTVDN